MNVHEAVAQFRADQAYLARKGIEMFGSRYATDDIKHDYTLAMDAQSALTTDPNTGVPSWLTMYTDPKVYEILFAENRAAEIYGESMTGDFTTDTANFPVTEVTGEVTSYGDFNENGVAGLNMNFPQRQAYRFQTTIEYGDLEVERAGLARVNWVSGLQRASTFQIEKYRNYTYFFGVSGLQNYGGVNDPNLAAAITPATKAYGGKPWMSGTTVVATANEIFNDIQATVIQLINQAAGLVNTDSEMVLALSPQSKSALTQTNSFAVNVKELIKENFPKMRVEDAVQFGQLSSTNTQGITGGNLMQVIAKNVQGQETCYGAFGVKLRAFPVIRAMSSYRQKAAANTFGVVLRMPIGIAQMLGI